MWSSVGNRARGMLRNCGFITEKLKLSQFHTADDHHHHIGRSVLRLTVFWFLKNLGNLKFGNLGNFGYFWNLKNFKQIDPWHRADKRYNQRGHVHNSDSIECDRDHGNGDTCALPACGGQDSETFLGRIPRVAPNPSPKSQAACHCRVRRLGRLFINFKFKNPQLLRLVQIRTSNET